MYTLKKNIAYSLLYLLTIGIILSGYFFVPNSDAEFPLLRSIIIVSATILLLKYFIYMVVSPWHNVYTQLRLHATQKKLTTTTNYNPKVSVLVPAWNEEEGVITTIKTLIKSTYKNIEILVIDNASTDKTRRNVREFMKKYDYATKHHLAQHASIVYIKEDQQGKGYALNRGIRAAKGEIIISIDADCSVPPDTIQNFVNHFKDPEVMAAVGNVKIGNTQTIIGVVQYLEFLFSFYFKKCDSLLGSIYIIGGAAGAFRKEVFTKLGAYSVTNITEDIDLSLRIQHAGMKIVYAQDAVVFTEGATDIAGLIKQRLRWKRGRVETFLKYRKLFFSTEKKHNKILSWFILPLAVFGDIQLFFELFFIVFLYIYSYLTHDFSSFIYGIIVVSSMFVVQIVFDRQEKKWGHLLLLAPIGWLLFYISTFVEFRALLQTSLSYLRKEDVAWQKWKRKGVFLSIPKTNKTSSTH